MQAWIRIYNRNIVNFTVYNQQKYIVIEGNKTKQKKKLKEATVLLILTKY